MADRILPRRQALQLHRLIEAGKPELVLQALEMGGSSSRSMVRHLSWDAVGRMYAGAYEEVLA